MTITKTKQQIIAFDLSLTNSGYAVGEVEDGELEIIEFGSISNKRFSRHSHAFRLNRIAEAVTALLKKYPDADAIVKEGSFSNSFIKSTQIIFKVVGVWELVAFLNGHEHFTDIAPNSVKKAVTGNGRAKKFQVAEAVKEITGLETANDDESDAIAVLLAYCADKRLIEIKQ